MESTAEGRADWQEADERVAQALREHDGEQQASDGAEVDPAEAEAAVAKCLGANRANTLALLACLRACDVPVGAERPYREVEAEVACDAAMGLTMQTPHTLIGMLVKAGGIERMPVEDDKDGATAPDAVDAESSSDSESAGAPQTSAVGSQPIDYVLRTTDAGRAAMATFDPAVRFGELIASEPQGYLDAYARVLDVCSAPEGATRAAVEQALEGHPALAEPKRIYPGYFISKLETVGGLSWDGAWRVTAAGNRMLAAFA